MTSKVDIVRVAVIQASPVFLDSGRSLEKAVRLIKEAASKGAVLAAFGEGWLPGYPFHAWAAASSDRWWELAAAYLDQAVECPGPTIAALCSAAREADIDVVIGVAERDPITRGSVHSAQLLLGREGEILGRHRKLKPASYERVVWADGDAVGLQVHDRGYGNVSGLVSSEHQMVLPTYALAEQGTQIHVASWPGRESRPAGSPLSMWPPQHLLSRAFAAQTGAYVLCAGGTLTRDAVPEPYREYLTHELTGDSVIIDPHGEVIAGPAAGETIVVADCSMAVVRSAKVAFDCAGHSSRRDQLSMRNMAAEGHDHAMPDEQDQHFDPSNDAMDRDFNTDQESNIDREFKPGPRVAGRSS